jgi:hypothetical protein
MSIAEIAENGSNSMSSTSIIVRPTEYRLPTLTRGVLHRRTETVIRPLATPSLKSGLNST